MAEGFTVNCTCSPRYNKFTNLFPFVSHLYIINLIHNSKLKQNLDHMKKQKIVERVGSYISWVSFYGNYRDMFLQNPAKLKSINPVGRKAPGVVPISGSTLNLVNLISTNGLDYPVNSFLNFQRNFLDKTQ